MKVHEIDRHFFGNQQKKKKGENSLPNRKLPLA